MNPFRYSVSLRIRHPSKAPEAISARLSLIPNAAWKSGSPRRTPKGELLEGVHAETYWSHRLGEQPGVPLAQFLETCVASLESSKDFLREIRSSNGKCELFVGWFSGSSSGELFDHRLLGRLAGLEIDLAFDVYGP